AVASDGASESDRTAAPIDREDGQDMTESFRDATTSFADATTLWELVERRAAATPDATLLIDADGGRLTCREFRDRTERTAAGFAARGIGSGTRVSWELPNRFE